MKILYHHRIASKDGQYVHVEELTNALKEAGHELLFVCPEFADKSDFGGEGGIAKRLKAILPKGIYELLEFSYSLIVAFKLVIAVIKFRPEFIYERYNLYQPVGVIIARLFGIPILLEVNAPLVQERLKYSGLAMPRFAKLVESFTWRNASYILPVTQVLAEHVVAADVDRQKVVVIPNGINRALLDQLDKKKSLDSEGKSCIVIGFTGFINPWHMLDRALDAIAKISNKEVKFICVGDGEIRHDLERQASHLGIENQVIFTGLVSRDQVFDYVSEFDIALQPSSTEYASPLKLFEYLACGALIIAPDMTNIREVLDENNSILFDPDLDDDFRCKLIYALENLKDLVPIRQAARQTIDIKKLTWQNNAAIVVNLAEKSLSTVKQRSRSGL